MVLGEDPYASDQATSGTSHECHDFEISIDEYVEILNELMRHRRATQCFDVLPKIFNNSYTFKNRRVLSTLGVFKLKNRERHASVTSKNFNPKDLGETPLQVEGD